MITCKTFYQHAGELILAVQENSFIGYEYMIKYGQGFYAAKLRIADVHTAAFQLSGVAGLTADDHENALGIYRYCK